MSEKTELPSEPPVRCIRLVGRCVEVGDDDEGQPRLIIHTTREQLRSFGRNLAYVDVEVTLHSPKLSDHWPTVTLGGKETVNKPETLSAERGTDSGAAPGSAILPCPYCEKTIEDKDPQTQEAAVIATCYTATNSNVVRCNWCGLSSPIFGTMDEAIEAWNSVLRKSPNAKIRHDAESAAPEAQKGT